MSIGTKEFKEGSDQGKDVIYQITREQLKYEVSWDNGQREVIEKFNNFVDAYEFAEKYKGFMYEVVNIRKRII